MTVPHSTYVMTLLRCNYKAIYKILSNNNVAIVIVTKLIQMFKNWMSSVTALPYVNHYENICVSHFEAPQVVDSNVEVIPHPSCT